MNNSAHPPAPTSQPEARSAGGTPPHEQLMTLLDKLRKRLNTSGVERTVGLRDNLGKDCPNYKKSLELFMERGDYMDIRNIIYELIRVYLLVEGNKENGNAQR